MTKSDAKEKALRWLDEATINGLEVSMDQKADLLDKFDFFLNDALCFLAGFFRLEGQLILDPANGEKKGNYLKYTMPEDFLDFDKIVVYEGDSYRELKDYKTEGEKEFLIPASCTGTVQVQYFRYPAQTDPDAQDSTTLDIAKKAELLLPLKLAVDATAGSEDTAQVSAYLDGKFSNFLANLLGSQRFPTPQIERIYSM